MDKNNFRVFWQASPNKSREDIPVPQRSTQSNAARHCGDRSGILARHYMDIAVIGAGLAGLSFAASLAKAGFIFLCTTCKLYRYVISLLSISIQSSIAATDALMHHTCLTGPVPGSDAMQAWTCTPVCVSFILTAEGELCALDA